MKSIVSKRKYNAYNALLLVIKKTKVAFFENYFYMLTVALLDN